MRSRTPWLGGAVAAILVPAILLPGGAPTDRVAAAGGNTIAGTVTTAGTDLPVVGWTVRACTNGVRPQCDQVAATTTDSSGDYALGSLPDSVYVVEVVKPPFDQGHFMGGWWTNTNVAGYAPDRERATPISLTGNDRTGIDVTVPVGRRIAGLVTIGGTTEPLAWMTIAIHACAMADSPCDATYWTATMANGQFESQLLPPDTYTVQLVPWQGAPYVSGWYADTRTGNFSPYYTQSTAIALATADAWVEVADPIGHTISGRITRADTGAGVGTTYVSVCPGSSTSTCWTITGTWTAADGTYTTPPVINGSYKIMASPPSGSGLRAGWYSASAGGHWVASASNASLVGVNGGDRAGIDIALPLAATPTPTPSATPTPRPSATPTPTPTAAPTPAPTPGRRTQTISFDPPNGGIVGATVMLAATTTSGLPITYSTSTPTICTLTGTTLQLIARGTCIVTAAQAGDAAWRPATAPQRISVFAAPATPRLVARLVNGRATSTTLRLARGARYVIRVAAPSVLAGERIRIYIRIGTSPWRAWGTRTLDENGRASIAIRATRNASYQWRFAGGSGYAAGSSSVLRIRLR